VVTARAAFEKPLHEIAWELPDQISDPPCLPYTYKFWSVKAAQADLVHCSDVFVEIKGGWLGLVDRADDLKTFCSQLNDFITANPALQKLIGGTQVVQQDTGHTIAAHTSS
jgi:hypothetical protein